VSSRLILLRHGNTFSDGDKVVMVGANEDLPLTAKGLEQATAMGEALRPVAKTVTALLAGPLLRTVQFAHRLQAVSGISADCIVDTRLVELDYGAWGGLSNEEIIAFSGKEVLDNWQLHGERPSGTVFKPSEEQLAQETASVLDEFSQIQGTVIIVSSNGRLREYARLIEGEVRSGAKVKTGHACIVDFSDEAWQIVAWDVTPDDLQAVLSEEL
jgi:broad specificity phosphatase PhoE